MDLTNRRTVLGALATSPLWLPGIATAQTQTLKISHQFAAGKADDGDFRDRLTRMFAAEVEKRSNGALKFSIYPDAQLMKPMLQFDALRSGKLDMTLCGLNYSSANMPELNIGLMPALVTSYAQAYGWKKQEIGRELNRILLEKGVVLISWIWQAGGVASSTKPLVHPADAVGMKVRGGSREMNMMLAAAGAKPVDNVPSSEIFSAMKSGRIEAAVTSSTSLLEFHLSEIAKSVVVSRGHSYWFIFSPLMMSKIVFDRLTPAQQAMLLDVGEKMEGFARLTAGLDDTVLAGAFNRAGLAVNEMTPDVIQQWQKIAMDTAWKDFRGHNANCARLLELAQKTL